MLSLLLITIRFDNNFLENYFRGKLSHGAPFWRLGSTTSAIFAFGISRLLWLL